jgi:hypothetical protein
MPALSRARHYTRYFEPDAIDVIAGGDVETPGVEVSKRDVGRTDLPLRLPADDR